MKKTIILDRNCIYCHQLLTQELLELTRPFFAFLQPSSNEYNIKVITSQDMETRNNPCTPEHEHTFDRQDYLGVDF